MRNRVIKITSHKVTISKDGNIVAHACEPASYSTPFDDGN